MLKHTIRKHSTIKIHLSLTLYCTEHDPHGSTKCLLFHSPTVMKLKLLCLSINGTLHDSGTIFKLPKKTWLLETVNESYSWVAQRWLTIGIQEVNINTAYHSLSGAALYIVEQITELWKGKQSSDPKYYNFSTV